MYIKNQIQVNERHRLNPKIGDYWHEMYNPVLVVTGVNENNVIVCLSRIEESDGWFWDLSKQEIWPRFVFSNFLLYGYIGKDKSIPIELKDGTPKSCYCNVIPKGHIETVNSYKIIDNKVTYLNWSESEHNLHKQSIDKIDILLTRLKWHYDKSANLPEKEYHVLSSLYELLNANKNKLPSIDENFHKTFRQTDVTNVPAVDSTIWHLISICPTFWNVFDSVINNKSYLNESSF